ncbi:MAG TPA: hypothetical protein PKA64_06000, partial [Myxococcota bacterium]|nr:hypothetical protein [Myxococcota bacterium]
MLLRPTRLALLSALACAEPPKDGPPAVDTDRAEPTPDDTPTPDARDTSEEAPPPVDTAGLPTCEQLGDACLMSGERPGPCGALRDACRDAPWSEPCVDAWFTCLAGDRPVLDCRLDLLTCLTAPPPAPDDG